MFSPTEFSLAFISWKQENIVFKYIYVIQGSIDKEKNNSPPLKRPSSSVDFDKSTGKSSDTSDIFNLLCIYEDTRTSQPCLFQVGQHLIV